MRATLIGFAFAAVMATAAHAQEPPVVVELFTSQGCSSCPPADAFLTDLAHQRHDVLPLAFHVTYWDSLGWKDPFSINAATNRQRDYAVHLGQDEVYTPQMVVNGSTSFVGSDRSQGLRAINAAARQEESDIPISLTRDNQTLLIKVGAGTGRANVVLVGFDPAHQTHIGRGENGGRTLLESNIVRSVTPVATWAGPAVELRQAAPAGEAFAVLLQTGNGHIIGAARAGS